MEMNPQPMVISVAALRAKARERRETVADPTIEVGRDRRGEMGTHQRILTKAPKGLSKEAEKGKAEAIQTRVGLTQVLKAKANPRDDHLAQEEERVKESLDLLLVVDPRRKARVEAKANLPILRRSLVRFSPKAFAIEVMIVGIFMTLRMSRLTLPRPREEIRSQRKRETNPKGLQLL